ncbi:hypothetical protein RSPO_m01619 (plasmid) [Ralstonia solanacearum Po82]|uniref:Uncharacterized protein n=1 Tax=Ralstonia solanacearum (strain Po82) TaxID=1031711 RepID=F6GB51_RALS8|nr:hypothetical protein RSPO_m01619 [Ralstonia solanacearum Po82]
MGTRGSKMVRTTTPEPDTSFGAIAQWTRSSEVSKAERPN